MEKPDASAKPDALALLSATLRIKQWIKNLFVFAPLVFSLNLLNSAMQLLALQTFAAFCLAASSVYIFNDMLDAEKDRQHPEKRHRPIASGNLSIPKAAVLGIICLLAGCGLARAVSPAVLSVILIYIGVNVFYTLKGKHIIILDAMIIASGFVLRVLVGALAISVQASSWLLLSTFFLALLIGFSKRYSEISLLQESSASHRQVLEDYDPLPLKHFLAIVAAITIMAYALYTMESDVIASFHTKYLIATVPFVVYGVLRYLYIVLYKGEGGDPSDLVIRDRPTLINLCLWIGTVLALIY